MIIDKIKSFFAFRNNKKLNNNQFFIYDVKAGRLYPLFSKVWAVFEAIPPVYEAVRLIAETGGRGRLVTEDDIINVNLRNFLTVRSLFGEAFLVREDKLTYKVLDNERVYVEDDTIFYDGEEVEDAIWVGGYKEFGKRAVSPVKVAEPVIEQYIRAIQAQNSLSNNLGITGILVLRGLAKVSEKQLTELELEMRKRFNSLENAGKVLVISNDVEWIPLARTTADLNLLEVQKNAVREIYNVWGIPSQLLNDAENKTYNNVKEARKSLITSVILPMLKELAVEISKLENVNVRVDVSVFDELSEDTVKLADALAKANWLTINEKREAMGYEALDIPEGDAILLNPNQIPIMETNTSEKHLKELFKNG